jgi:putative ABC transport system substrate-binding protein
VGLEARHALPAIYAVREFVVVDGRGAHPSKGEKREPTGRKVVINTTTAKALGLEVPPMLLARADEVIE